MGAFVGNESPEEEQSPSIQDEVDALLAPAEQPDESPAPEAPAEPEQYVLGDMTISAEELPGVQGLINWASTLSEDQVQQIFAYTSGEVELAAPEAEYEEEVEEEEPDYFAQLDEMDPDLAAAMREQYEDMQAREAELREQIDGDRQRLDAIEQHTASQVYETTQAQIEQAEQAAASRFVEAYGEIDDDTYIQLVQTAGRMNIVDGLVNEHGMEDGMYQALEAAMYVNPELRDQLLAEKVGQLAASQQASSRKDAAASLGNPVAGTNIPNVNPANLPQNERHSAMARDIEALLGQS